MRRRKGTHPVSLPYARVEKRLGMSEAAYVAAVEVAPVRKVRIRDLFATQRHVSPTRVLELFGHKIPKGHRSKSTGALDDRPVVIRVTTCRHEPGPVCSGSDLYLVNGHHRVEGRILRGKRRVRVRLVDL